MMKTRTRKRKRTRRTTYRRAWTRRKRRTRGRRARATFTTRRREWWRFSFNMAMMTTKRASRRRTRTVKRKIRRARGGR